MKSKNLILLSLLVISILINAFLVVWEPGTTKLDFDTTYFSVSDTSDIQSIEISKNGVEVVTLQKKEGWRITQQDRADTDMLRVIKEVIRRQRILRRITGNAAEKLLQETENAIYVSIQADKQRSFQMLSNNTKTKTYFITDGEVYEMGVPGYSDYIGGIYELTPNQWKDREIFDGNWRTIQNLTINKGTSEMVKLKFQEAFFLVNDTEKVDSAAVVEYLQQFQGLKANERISKGQFERYDSLLASGPEYTIEIDDIKIKQPKVLNLYPKLSGETIRLITDQRGEMMVFADNRADALIPDLKELLR
ncbi:MAG: hypothetical protein JXQ90_22610 [Cyclobacteriaceae bacterium]